MTYEYTYCILAFGLVSRVIDICFELIHSLIDSLLIKK